MCRGVSQLPLEIWVRLEARRPGWRVLEIERRVLASVAMDLWSAPAAMRMVKVFLDRVRVEHHVGAQWPASRAIDAARYEDQHRALVARACVTVLGAHTFTAARTSGATRSKRPPSIVLGM